MNKGYHGCHICSIYRWQNLYRAEGHERVLLIVVYIGKRVVSSVRLKIVYESKPTKTWCYIHTIDCYAKISEK